MHRPLRFELSILEVGKLLVVQTRKGEDIYEITKQGEQPCFKMVRFASKRTEAYGRMLGSQHPRDFEQCHTMSGSDYGVLSKGDVVVIRPHGVHSRHDHWGSGMICAIEVCNKRIRRVRSLI